MSTTTGALLGRLLPSVDWRRRRATTAATNATATAELTATAATTVVPSFSASVCTLGCAPAAAAVSFV